MKFKMKVVNCLFLSLLIALPLALFITSHYELTDGAAFFNGVITETLTYITLLLLIGDKK